jgi:hypothetical protein
MSRLALAVRLLDEVVHQLARAVVHLDVERLHLVGEVVERHNGRDGDEQTERGRDQSFRNTAGDCADTRGLLVAMAWKAFKNTDDGAEQADERGRRTDRGQTAKAALQLGVNDGFGTLEGALGALDLLFGDAPPEPKLRNSCRPAVTTSARCDFLSGRQP